MPDIRDAQDSWMKGRRAFERWQADFDARWNAPENAENLIEGLQQIPLEIFDRLPPAVRDSLLEIRGGK